MFFVWLIKLHKNQKVTLTQSHSEFWVDYVAMAELLFQTAQYPMTNNKVLPGKTQSEFNFICQRYVIKYFHAEKKTWSYYESTDNSREMCLRLCLPLYCKSHGMDGVVHNLTDF